MLLHGGSRRGKFGKCSPRCVFKEICFCGINTLCSAEKWRGDGLPSSFQVVRAICSPKPWNMIYSQPKFCLPHSIACITLKLHHKQFCGLDYMLYIINKCSLTDVTNTIRESKGKSNEIGKILSDFS